MLLDAAKEPSDHIRKLDDAIRRLAEFKITISLLPELDLAHRAVDVLKRMPRDARLYREENDERVTSRMDSAFFVHETDNRTSKELLVIKFLPTPVLQLAVLVTSHVPHRQNCTARQREISPTW